MIHGNRGDLELASRVFETYARYENSRDVQEASAFAAGHSLLLNLRAKHADALAAAESVLTRSDAAGDASLMTKIAFAEAVDAAFALGDLDLVRSLIDRGERLKSIRISPVIRALVDRSAARLAVATGETEGVDALFGGAAGLFRETGVRFWLAATLTEHGEWSCSQGREAEGSSLLEEARSIFESLGATTWRERLDSQPAAARG
jgi:hypothetical protein